MTQDEIIEMARQCSFTKHFEFEKCLVCNPESLYHFAKLVVAKEREGCADMVFRYISQTDNMEARGCLSSVAYDIRARGEA